VKATTSEPTEVNPLLEVAIAKLEKYGKVEFRLKGCGDRIYYRTYNTKTKLSPLKSDDKKYTIVEVL